MGASNHITEGNFAKELEEELMKYTTNHEDYKVDPFLVDQTEKVNWNADVEVNITERTNFDGNELVEAECPDTTESSSSFDDSDSGVENVDTLVHSEAYASDLDFELWFNEIGRMRNKKVTTHWRSFIQPLMWRCKWIEMQIEKLEAQAREYDKKLEECWQQKQVQSDKSILESLGMKSLPFSHNSARNKVFQRKKRRRNEATMDVAAYMSHHNVFSYYEKRKFSTECMDDALKNPEVDSDDEFWGNDEPLCLETGNDDIFLQHIFQKIGFLQVQVGQMKSRVDKLTSENVEKLSCTDNLSMPTPCEGLIDLHPDNEETMPLGSKIASQLVSEYNTGNVLVPQRAVTNRGEVVANVNGSSNHVYFAGAYGNEEDEVLIDNRRVKEEMMFSFEEAKIQPIQRPRNDQRPPKIRSTSKLTAPKSKTDFGKTKGTSP
ncbi:hypothetical protein BUALT_Bualt19G0022700 [Buddleja alternifolia]|uniref:Uncharacterized protein n=1 Tax=Buddleja alternifolia TaxID=168488 RepID=A0AAV6W6Q5_9LAMI|nr:hypothetical protein BUALT_Bualt19G0022700 [Buddleja alternifolia]